MYYVLILLVKQRVTAITAKPPPQPGRANTALQPMQIASVTTVDTIDGNWYYRSTTQMKMNCSPAIL